MAREVRGVRVAWRRWLVHPHTRSTPQWLGAGAGSVRGAGTPSHTLHAPVRHHAAATTRVPHVLLSVFAPQQLRQE